MKRCEYEGIDQAEVDKILGLGKTQGLSYHQHLLSLVNVTIMIIIIIIKTLFIEETLFIEGNTISTILNPL